MNKIRVDILGLSTSTSSGGAYALILREVEGARRLPIIIGAFEAQAIALEIEGIKPPRPMTHDLLKDVIDTLGYTITEVTITELREGTFYARLSMDTAVGDEVDSRPSDAIALAVRYNVPIFVNEEVLAEAGFVPEGEDTADTLPDTDAIVEPRERQKAELQEKLDDAIKQEDYEEAARLRDELLRLQSGD
ncbi:MAG: bifunctional nuclease family protein [Bacteroidetes bacterium]|nr:bifunctional nuclease family protein [Bacteroidota bacterium]